MLRVRGAGTAGLTFLWSLDSNLHAKCKVSKPSSLQEFPGCCSPPPHFLPVLVDQGIKRQAILPAGGEVGDIDVGVAASKRNIKT